MSGRVPLRSIGGAIGAAVLVLAVGPAASAAGPDRTPPTTPTGLRATAVTHTGVTLSWNRSTDNVGVTTYTVWADGAGLQGIPASQTTATFTSLRPGKSYTFRVVASDAWYNVSAYSSPLTVTTLADTTAPTAPSGLTVSTVTASKVRLTWTSGTDEFGPPKDQVLVNGVPTPNAFSTTAVGSPTPSVQGAWVRQLTPDTGYTFTVRSVDESGNVSLLSNAVSATTQPSSDATAPTTPTLTSVSVGGVGYCPEELWMQWSGSTDNAEAATAIEYEVRVNGTIKDVAVGFTKWISFTDILGVNTVTLVAVDSAGNASAPSNAETRTTNWGAEQGCPA